MAMKRCAHIDPNGVYLGMVEIDEEAWTARHLPQIPACDLKPLEYRWMVDPGAPHGGRFEPLLPHQRPKADTVPDLERAFYATLKALDAQGTPLAIEAAAWLAWYEKSWDSPRR